MALLPQSRAEFKSYCLRKLGAPVINIDVDDSQLEDRINEALNWWWDYHYFGSEKTYYKYEITPTDITNKYITLPNNIIGAVKIFDITTAFNSQSIFNINYQIALNDLYTLTSLSMVPYFMTMQQLQFINELLVGKQPIRYNQYTNKFYVDMDWNKFLPGQYLVIECYRRLDPEVDGLVEIYSDRWLLMYATALIKQQWGSNLKKFGNMQMPGGIVFNGQQLFDEATEELEKLRNDLIHSYSLPVVDLIG